MAVEGPHLMPGEGFGLGMVLLENMLDGLEDYNERFDQSLGCVDFLLMSAVFENILPKFCNVAAAFNWLNWWCMIRIRLLLRILSFKFPLPEGGFERGPQDHLSICRNSRCSFMYVDTWCWTNIITLGFKKKSIVSTWCTQVRWGDIVHIGLPDGSTSQTSSVDASCLKFGLGSHDMPCISKFEECKWVFQR